MGRVDWKSVLAKVAPGIATALGGPMAGVAVSMATKALGIDDGDEDALAMAVASGDPNILVKLKEVDNDFKLELKRLDITLEEMNTSDRRNARWLAIKNGMVPQIALSVIYTVGYFTLMYMLLKGSATISAEIMPLMGPLIGVMTGAQVQIMNFWFGSSSGSKEKTNAMSAVSLRR